MEKVSYTAQWTAAARALESERGAAARFRDEYARLLASDKGFELLARYKGTAVADYVALRTKFVDDAILQLLDQQTIEQVVLVASGMDTRAYRLPWPNGVTLYEVDHVDLLTFKNTELQAYMTKRLVPTIGVGADLAGDWVPKLKAAGHDPQRPSLWVAEGLFFFLSADQAAALLQVLARHATRESWLVTDMISQSLLTHPITQPFLKTLRSDGTPWIFGTDDPEGFLRDNGWQAARVAQPGEPGAGEGHWPYSPVPRAVRGVPRNWLITARRT
ncbi:MAG: SAM-dependent methyltransferase [Thiomonas sp. 13-66-29]|jgi:methyltransferase (TIGR00027 family)|nr:MAG: SAM-dependent methyltransferase [Thiomonas sp. 13-66-29]